MTADAVIFDTEYTTWEGALERAWSGPGEHRELVQIGAVRFDPASLEETGSFECLIQPKINSELSDYFCRLTGITKEAVSERGLAFLQAYERFLAFVGDAPLLCYGRDDEVVAENLMLYGLGGQVRAITATNLQPWFADCGIDVACINSGKLARAVGAEVPGAGAEHDALFDCRSMLAAVRHLTSRGAVFPAM